MKKILDYFKQQSSLNILFAILFVYIILFAKFPYLGVDIVKYLLYQAFIMIMPAIVFSRWIFKDVRLNVIESIAFGYPISIFALFLLYYIGEIIGFNYTSLVLVLFSVKLLLDIKNCKIKFENINTDLSLFTVIICLISVGIFFILYTITAGEPSTGEIATWYQDSLWTVGNTWAVLRGIPFIDSHFTGVPMGYHLLENIHHASIYRIVGVDPFRSLFFLDPIFIWFLIISSLVFGAHKIAKLTPLHTKFFAVLFLFTSSYLGRYIHGYQFHLFWNPISLFFGMNSFLLMIFMLHSFFEGEQKNSRILYIGFLFFVISGTKGNLMAIIPLSLLVFFAVIAIKNKTWLPPLKMGILFFIVGLIMKFTLFAGSAGNITSYVVDTMPSTNSAVKIQSIIGNNGLALLLYNIMVVMKIFLKYITPIFLLPSFLIYVATNIISREFRASQKKHISLVFYSLIFTLISMLLISTFDFSGGAPYFVYYPVMLIIYFSSSAFAFLWNKNREMKFLVGLFLLISISFFVNSIVIKTVKGPWWQSSMNQDKSWDLQATISKNEFDALQWIKRETDPGAVVISDREGFMHEGGSAGFLSRFYGYSALCGRQMYNEGAAFTTDEFNDLIEGHQIAARLASKGDKSALDTVSADYLIQSLRFNEIDISNVAGLEDVFKNEDIIIYQIINK